MPRDDTGRSALARAGFAELSANLALLDDAVGVLGIDRAASLALFARCADPDGALARLIELARRHPDPVRQLVADPDAAARLVMLLGASEGLAEFLGRDPGALGALRSPGSVIADVEAVRAELDAAVDAAPDEDDAAWSAIRRVYRRHLTVLACADLQSPDPVAAYDAVSASLADLAAAALDASLRLARRRAVGAGVGRFGEQEVADTALAVIGMGKAGARELNYVSDVDVIFVAEGHGDTSSGRAIDIATVLARQTMRGVSAPAVEPPLWEVDANLRPEGKDGALVRTLESHEAYYGRWAKSWEFQALLKARALAGDLDLGARYVAAVAPLVWSSAARENFVESVQRMRERVTENIPDDEVDQQLKLGPGGLRDIEFTVQLLQLVHGYVDPAVRQANTLQALTALAAGGYVGRERASAFADDYRMLRVIEHRLQLRRLRRTHLMPREESEVRILARATGLAATAADLTDLWAHTKRRVRGLHERLFYRPLLAAVAALPPEERRLTEGATLTAEQAEARLAAIGFADPHGALAHIAALTAGISRRATIQRHLLPVLLQWFSEGADPDYGLLTFRKLSEDLGATHWYLRMLRDSSGAAQRLTRVLSGSRFVGELVGLIPECVAWLDDDDDLRPRSLESLHEESSSILHRHDDVELAARALRGQRRREVLRLAFSCILGLCTVEELGHGLADVTDTLLQGLLTAVRRAAPAELEFAIIAMGRFGGRELGFGSDADVIYVFRARGDDAERAHPAAAHIAAELARLTEDPRLPLELDLGLRPEGKNGPTTRSLESYRAYYRRWSLTWEAQALLRARPAAGDPALADDFIAVADAVRYPEQLAAQDVREVKRIKARVEAERLPQGAEPARHLKLGRGSLSDVEWFVQLLQLQHGASLPALRTPSTLDALAAEAAAGLVSEDDAGLLHAAWLLASRARSALTLWANKTTDVLPRDRQSLDGVARLLGYPAGSATRIEEDYLAATRRARAVFERGFYG